MIDFVHPATTHDETIVTLHSLLDRDVYRGGAIVVGPVRRGPRPQGPGRAPDRPGLRQTPSAACRCSSARSGGSRSRTSTTPSSTSGRRSPAPASTRRAGAGRRRCSSTTRPRSCAAASCSPACSATAPRSCGSRRCPRSRRCARPRPSTTRSTSSAPGAATTSAPGCKVLLQALVEKRIGRRDQAQAWVWRLASYTRELHEEYAVQRWPETKRLLGLLVNSSGRAHGRNARRLVHAARKQDRRLAVALLAAAVAHTPEGEEVLRGARMRMARKPSAIARELLRNFPKGGKRRRKRKKRRRRQGRWPEGRGPGRRPRRGRGRPARRQRGRARERGRARRLAVAGEVDLAGAERLTARRRRCGPAGCRARRCPRRVPEPRRPRRSRGRAGRRAGANAASTSSGFSRCPAAEARVERGERGADGGAAADRGRGLAQLLRELLRLDRDVEADADHRPAVLGAGLDQHPGALAPLDPDVVGPLHPGSGRRRDASTASQTASGTASGSSRWRRSSGRRIAE